MLILIDVKKFKQFLNLWSALQRKFKHNLREVSKGKVKPKQKATTDKSTLSILAN